MMWFFGVERSKVKVTGLISAFFTLTTAMRRGFELFECFLVADDLPDENMYDFCMILFENRTVLVMTALESTVARKHVNAQTRRSSRGVPSLTFDWVVNSGRGVYLEGGRTGAPPKDPAGELTALPQTP